MAAAEAEVDGDDVKSAEYLDRMNERMNNE